MLNRALHSSHCFWMAARVQFRSDSTTRCARIVVVGTVGEKTCIFAQRPNPRKPNQQQTQKIANVKWPGWRRWWWWGGRAVLAYDFRCFCHFLGKPLFAFPAIFLFVSASPELGGYLTSYANFTQAHPNHEQLEHNHILTRTERKINTFSSMCQARWLDVARIYI